MQRLQARRECGVRSICMALGLRKWLGLADKPADVTTISLNGQIMAHVSKSQRTMFTMQYMEHSSPVQESELLVLPMRAYDLVLGLPWFQSRKPEVEWQCGRQLALQTSGGAAVVAVDRVDHQECPGNSPGSMAREEASSEGGGGIPDIQILRATPCDDLLACEQVVGTFFLRVGECTGQQGATVEGITDREWNRP